MWSQFQQQQQQQAPKSLHDTLQLLRNKAVQSQRGESQSSARKRKRTRADLERTFGKLAPTMICSMSQPICRHRLHCDDPSGQDRKKAKRIVPIATTPTLEQQPQVELQSKQMQHLKTDDAEMRSSTSADSDTKPSPTSDSKELTATDSVQGGDNNDSNDNENNNHMKDHNEHQPSSDAKLQQQQEEEGREQSSNEVSTRKFPRRSNAIDSKLVQLWHVYKYGLQEISQLSSLTDAPDALLPGNFVEE